jgi:hypothetical protein
MFNGTPNDLFDWREDQTVAHDTQRWIALPNRQTTSKPPSGNSHAIKLEKLGEMHAELKDG